MDWLDEVKSRIKRNNQVLFAKDSEFLQDVIALIQKQNHRTLALWALELAEETAQTLTQRYPGEPRFKAAVTAAQDWAQGKVKMRFAQRAILDVHAVAKEIDSPEDIALCHAVGQACGVVHAPGHAIGFPVYELTAIIRRYGVDNCREPVESRKKHYIDRLLYWEDTYSTSPYEWASFMLKD